MDQEEALKRVDHYRCRLCGQESPITAINCTRGSCGAQLGLYGDIVFGEDNIRAEEPAKKTEAPKEKPAAKTKSRREKVRKETFAQPQGSFLPKKTLLIWLDVILLLLYVIMVNAATWFFVPVLEDSVGLLCIGLLLLTTSVEIFLACKDKFVARGLVGILQAFLCFMISGFLYSFALPDALGIFLVMPVIYLWKAVLSFIGTSKKRRALAASGQAPEFLSKKVFLIWLNMILTCLSFLLCNLYIDAYIMYYVLQPVLQLVLMVIGFLCARKEKYGIWSIGLWIYGAGIILANCGLPYQRGLLLPLAALGVLHIALGILAFGKIRKDKA